MAPRVSLALHVFNGERFVEEAIRSILAQDYQDFELIITDNASTDRTAEICQRFAVADERIRYVRNNTNVGAGPNFNLGFELSRAEYFKWCAADDLMSKDYVGACVRALDADRDSVLAFGATQSIDQSGQMIKAVSKMMPNVEDLEPADRFRHVVPASRMACYEIFGLFRSDALKRSSLHQMYYGSDRALLAEMALLGKLVRVPDITFFSREHSDRSVHLINKKERMAWHNTSAKRRLLPFEHWRFLGHLIEIAIRHRRVAPLRKTLWFLLQWATTPRQLARYAGDVVAFVSPTLWRQAHSGGWKVVRGWRRQRVQSQKT